MEGWRVRWRDGLMERWIDRRMSTLMVLKVAVWINEWRVRLSDAEMDG